MTLVGSVAAGIRLRLDTGYLQFLDTVSKIVPGTTGISLRNNADSANNLLITDAGAATFRSTVGGITTLTATTLAGTLSTAAQPNVTSLGTIAALVAGTGTFSGLVTIVSEKNAQVKWSTATPSGTPPDGTIWIQY
jgi:hypothetical protein